MADDSVYVNIYTYIIISVDGPASSFSDSRTREGVQNVRDVFTLFVEAPTAKRFWILGTRCSASTILLFLLPHQRMLPKL